MEAKNENSREGSNSSPPKQSFEALYKKFYRRLVGFFRKRGFSPPDSEDLAQDSLVRAYRYYSDFRFDSSADTWIFKIAWNVWRNRLRRDDAAKRSAEIESLDAEDRDSWTLKGSDLDLGEGPLGWVLNNEERALVLEAVSRLPKQMQECLRLYIYGALSYAEIALFQGIHLNTVKSTISQAKKRLRSDLKKQYPDRFAKDENGGPDEN